MKTLDDQVPSGYFEALPNKTLARLEGKDMQSTTGTTNEREPEVVAPPPPAGVKEDSGLHDIRSLAQSTKQRMANKRTTTSPVKTDDELLAASSAGWVALPEPAKMVSLPALDELPSKKELRDEMKASKAASVAADMPAGASAAISRPAFGANLTARKKSSKAPVAIAGIVLAAAAGVGIYVFTQNESKDSAPVVAKAEATQGAVAATPPPAVAQKAPEPPPPPAPEPAVAATDSGAAAGSAAVEQPVEIAKAEPVKTKGGSSKPVPTKSKPGSKKSVAPEETAPQKVETKTVDEPKKPEGKKGGKGDENEPSFDALLKEAGVDQTKKQAAPKLAKKELSRPDFTAGMAAVKNAAQACYKGTQGTASFKMVIAPSGSVQSVSFSGQFAGKPEASCVESAVRGAHFPPWDGGPQTFTYSYLLAE